MTIPSKSNGSVNASIAFTLPIVCWYVSSAIRYWNSVLSDSAAILAKSESWDNEPLSPWGFWLVNNINGLYEEAEGLYANRKLAALQTVGYQELFKAMEQKISNENAIELIKRNTRRYAKRQMTWLRRESKYTLLETNNEQTIEK